jgi:hypothetical protein
VPRREPEAAQPQPGALPQQARERRAPRARPGRADLGEQRVERGQAALDVTREQPLLGRVPPAVASRRGIGALGGLQVHLRRLGAAAGFAQRGRERQSQRARRFADEPAEPERDPVQLAARSNASASRARSAASCAWRAACSRSPAASRWRISRSGRSRAAPA